MKVLQETCEEAFQASQAYGMLLEKAEVDEAEMEALKKVRIRYMFETYILVEPYRKWMVIYCPLTSRRIMSTIFDA